MSDYIGVVTNAGQAKIAAAIGGTALNLTAIRVGDGNGAPITPNPAMTDLVRRVGAAYPIISSGRDPVNANHWRVTALIPVDDGPFDIREIGVWDAAGEMIAVARHVLVEKRTPAQGAAVEILTDIVFPVSETAQVTVQVNPAGATSLLQLLRAGFMVVESATVAAPPGAPALGRTHVVPAGATGAWAGLAGYLAQWNGTVWVVVDVPAGFVVVALDKAINHVDRWLRRTGAGWVSANATEAAYGVTRRATAAEIALRSAVDAFLGPADVSTLIKAGTPQIFLASGTYTPQVPDAEVHIIAPGGGGGASGDGSIGIAGNQGGGGSAGGYARDVITGLTVGVGVAITIGARGLGVFNNSGSAGGSCSFGGYLSASGGGGGAWGAGTLVAGGGSGNGAGGGPNAIKILGGQGGASGPNAGTYNNQTLGTVVGRGAIAAGGLSTISFQGTGQNGTGYGSGGNGGSGGVGGKGGDGAPGIIIVIPRG